MSIVLRKFVHTDCAYLSYARRILSMMNENNNNVNTSIGCGVTECKFNCKGDYCTLSKIHVCNTCSCEEAKCTCCDSFQRK